jgi:hypothetical protein
MTKSRGINAPKRTWPAEDLALLSNLYACTYTPTLAKLFECKIEQIYSRAAILKLNKSKWYRNSPMAQTIRPESLKGLDGRFKPGHMPANKGVKGISYPGMEATQFKPGTKPPNHKPVGSTRIDTKDGYVYIKMAEGMFQFKLLHRVIWERMNGPIPPGYLVSFIDQNKQNCRITNLTLLTKKQNALRNSIHNYGPEIAQIYQLKGAITRQINKRQRKENE